KMELGEFDNGGRRKSVPVKDSEFSMAFDTVIPAVSQVADTSFTAEIDKTRWGTFNVDSDTFMTSLDGVFAGGDIVHGPDTVIRAIADGKQAAEAIDKYLGGRGVLNKGPVIEIDDVASEDEVVELNRYPLDMLDPEKRKHSFDEVVKGYHKLTAMAEAMRCLHCERR
ncbi:MAG: hydrogenase, partial [Clostridiales bacterium]|nr:hydrogenase [Clostridiales bacterium]